MISLGFSVGHEMGAVIIKDGEVLIGIIEERLNKEKFFGAYSYQLPILSIKYCLENSGLDISQIDRFIYNSAERPDNYSKAFEEAFGIPGERIEYIPHHLAHAFSSFYSSGFEDSAVLVIDASGSEVGPEDATSNSWYPDKALDGERDGRSYSETVSIFTFDKDGWKEEYKRWASLPHESSVGIQYESAALQLTYDEETNGWQAGKVMGMASYANRDFVKKFPEYVTFENGEAIIPPYSISPEITYKSDFQSKANLAGVYQREQERLVMHFVEKTKSLSSSRNLCVSGGSFLNCNSNELIEKSGLFEKTYYLPSATDSGIPLGCAWYGQTGKTSGKYFVPYIGKEYSNGEILGDIFSSDVEVHFEEMINWEDLYDRVSDYLIDNKVIGWFQGGGENGPRALGNRSILANPSTPWMEKYINSEIKGREWYRPFAPSVLYENQSEIFELDTFSPYMLITTKVKEGWRNKIPAVVHIDHTSRYQSVTPEMNTKYYSLISKFKQKTGIPLVLNTSFNGKDEPVVETPGDAIRTFLRTGLHVLVMNNIIVTKLGK